jgi:hypothetical protein
MKGKKDMIIRKSVRKEIQGRNEGKLGNASKHQANITYNLS